MQGVVSTPGVSHYCDNTYRLLRLGTSLRGDRAGYLDHAMLSHAAHTAVMGAHVSAVPCPLGAAQRSSRDAARDQDFCPCFLPYVEKEG